MADVTRRFDGPRRAQLLILAGLLLAIVFVGIALVLNTAIFAENLATRTTQQESSEVVAFEREAAQGLEAAIVYLNHNTSAHGSYSDLNNSLGDITNRWQTRVARGTALSGRHVDVDIEDGSIVNGTRIAQDNGSEFTPEGNNISIETTTFPDVTYWTVAPDVQRMRHFTMTANRTELSNFTGSKATGYLKNLSGNIDASDPPFTVVYNESGSGAPVDHAFTVYKNNASSDPDDVNLSYYSDGNVIHCEVEDPPETFRIDVSGARVQGAGGACSDLLGFAPEITADYRLYYIQGEWMHGDYQFTLNENRSSFADDYSEISLNATDYYSKHSDGHGDSYDPSSPYIELAIYSAKVNIGYQSNSANYESTIRVAPNEP